MTSKTVHFSGYNLNVLEEHLPKINPTILHAPPNRVKTGEKTKQTFPDLEVREEGDCSKQLDSINSYSRSPETLEKIDGNKTLTFANNSAQPIARREKESQVFRKERKSTLSQHQDYKRNVISASKVVNTKRADKTLNINSNVDHDKNIQLVGEDSRSNGTGEPTNNRATSAVKEKLRNHTNETKTQFVAEKNSKENFFILTHSIIRSKTESTLQRKQPSMESYPPRAKSSVPANRKSFQETTQKSGSEKFTNLVEIYLDENWRKAREMRLSRIARKLKLRRQEEKARERRRKAMEAKDSAKRQQEQLKHVRSKHSAAKAKRVATQHVKWKFIKGENNNRELYGLPQ